MIDNDRRFDCPLCGIDFTGAACHASCPFARGCAMVRCPACGYEFIEDGWTTRVLRWLRERRRRTRDLSH